MSSIHRLLIPGAMMLAGLLGVGTSGTGLQAQLAPSSLPANAKPETLPPAIARAGEQPLQFTAGGHVLGFSREGVVTAAANHMLKVDFVASKAVAPMSEGAPAGARPGRAQPLQKVTYRNAWEGVSVVYEAKPGAIAKSTYYVNAGGAGARDIRLRYNRPVQLDAQGNLVIAYDHGTMVEAAPVAWQEIGGKRQPVKVAYALHGEREVGFAVGAHVAGVPLVIDPTLNWNAFLGGSGSDSARGIAWDTGGNVYVTGSSTVSWGSPITGFAGASDAFVAKLSGAGVLAWNTFLGGTGNEYGFGIAVDGSGNVFVTGQAETGWAPSGGLLAHFGSGTDAFVAKLTGSTGAVQWNTFLGGSGADTAFGVAVNGGNVYVAGSSAASWPVAPAPKRTHYGSGTDAFVAALDGSGNLSWNTFLGGSDTDVAYGITVDGSGNVYAAGSSAATWQGSSGPKRAHYGSGIDAFVAALDSTGNLTWNAFLGGAETDVAYGVAVTGGNVYVVGSSSADWGTPTRGHTVGTDTDAFVVKLSSDLGALAWNTFLGTGGTDEGYGIAVDGTGYVYVSGNSSATWGTPLRAYGTGTDAFAAKLDDTPAQNGALLWNTFLGGSGSDIGYGIAVDGNMNIYVAGMSGATWGTPTRSYTASNDGFVAKIAQAALTVTSGGVLSPHYIGTDVIFTAAVLEGGATYEYAFYWYNTSTKAFELMRSFHTTATWTLPANSSVPTDYVPTPLGKNTLLVYARPTGLVSADAQWYEEYVVTPPPAVSVALSADKSTPMIQGTPVIFTATPVGSAGFPFATYSAHYQYRFQQSYDLGVTYTTTQDYSTARTWRMSGKTMLTPNITNPYTIKVDVRTNAAAASPDQTGTMDFKLIPANNVDLAFTVLTPLASTTAPVGTSVTLQAVAGPGAANTYYYQFWYYNGARWDFVPREEGTTSGWSRTDTFDLPTTTFGNYKAQVRASKYSTGPWENYKSLSYTVTKPATGLTIDSASSPHLNETPVTFTANATGGGPVYYYKFYWAGPDAPDYSAAIVQDWGTSPTFTRPTGTAAGNYRLKVETRTGPTIVDLFTEINPYVIVATPPAVSVTLSASPASPQFEGTAVTFTATGTGAGTLNYKFSLSNDNEASWSIVQNNSTSTWVMVDTTAPSAANVPYRVKVEVTADNGSSATTMSFQLKPLPATGLTVAASKLSPQRIGTDSIVFTPTATRGAATPACEYAFYWYDEVIRAYVLKQAYGVAATWTLPTDTAVTVPGRNTLLVYARRTGTTVGLDVSTYVAYQITPGPAESVSFTAPVAAGGTQGTAVAFTALATGSSGYEYQFWLSFDAGASWTLKQDYSATATWTMPSTQMLTPSGVAYQIKVNVRTDSAVATPDKTAIKSFLLSAPAAPIALSVTLTASVPSWTFGSPNGTLPVFTAVAHNGTGAGDPFVPNPLYLYQFWFFNATRWDMVQVSGVSHGWSTKSTFTLPAGLPVASTYKVQVRASQLPLASIAVLGWQAYTTLSPYAITAP